MEEYIPKSLRIENYPQDFCRVNGPGRLVLLPMFLSLRRLFLKTFTEMNGKDITQSLLTRKLAVLDEIGSINVG